MKRNTLLMISLAVMVVLTISPVIPTVSKHSGFSSQILSSGSPRSSHFPQDSYSSNFSHPPTFTNWRAWHEFITHQPTSGRGCFEAKYPNPVWQRTTCATSTSDHETPSSTTRSMSSAIVGNTNDYVAQSSSSSLIGSALGSFPSVSGITGENDVCVAPFLAICTNGGAGANAYSLQVNTQGGFPVTFNGKSTTGWEQFLFSNEPSGFQGVWIEFWLFGYSNAYLNGGPCSSLPIPSGASGTWYGPTKAGDCYFNTVATSTPFEPASSLSLLSLRGTANAGGNDVAQLCVTGGSCYTNSQPAAFLNLSQQWTLAEFNVVGFVSGSRAQFNSGTSITVQNSLFDQSGNPMAAVGPCPNNGQTGETNNLNLLDCTASSSGISFRESSFDFSISASPSDSTILSGEMASYTVTLTLLSEPADSVTLAVSGLPIGATYTVSPVTWTMGGATSTLNVFSAVLGSLGDFPLTIKGADGALTHSTTVNLHVYDFSVASSPSDRTVLRGSSTSYTVTLTLLAGSTTSGLPAIRLTPSGLPSDSTNNFVSTFVTPSLAGAPATLTIATGSAPSGSLGDFAFTIKGTDQLGGSRTGSGNLHIYDFTVTAPANLLILESGKNSWTVTLTLTPGSSAIGLPSITLSDTGLPAGATAFFTPSSGSLSLTSTFNVTTVNTAAGSYTLTLTGTDSRSPDGGTRTTSATLQVLTPQQAIQLSINQINTLRSSGMLTPAQAMSLTSQLSAAKSSLNAGHVQTACNQLTSFVNSVKALVRSGTLTQAQANQLLNPPLGVLAIMASIPC